IQFNKNDTIIIGAGGMARELASWINTYPSEDKLSIIGFMDDNINALDNYNIKIPLIGTIDLLKVEQNQSIVFGIMNSAIKQNLFLEAQEHKLSVSHFIHSTVLVGSRTKMGIGIVVFPNVIISCDITIGNLVFINCGSQIGHDVRIGNF